MSHITIMLQGVVKTLALIETDELEAHVTECRRHLDHWTGIGPLIDPTQYRKAIQSGEQQDAVLQMEIAEALLKARQMIDRREAYVRSLPGHYNEESTP